MRNETNPSQMDSEEKNQADAGGGAGEGSVRKVASQTRVCMESRMVMMKGHRSCGAPCISRIHMLAVKDPATTSPRKNSPATG